MCAHASVVFACLYLCLHPCVRPYLHKLCSDRLYMVVEEVWLQVVHTELQGAEALADQRLGAIQSRDQRVHQHGQVGCVRHRHRQTQPHRHRQIQAPSETGTVRHRHRQTQPHRHRQTQAPSDTGTVRHRHRQTQNFSINTSWKKM